MDTSLFLAKFLGVYLIVIGLFVAIRPKDVAKLADGLNSNLVLRYMGGIMALIFGLVLVLMHNVWVGTWEVAITILAWGSLIKGVLILLFPEFLFKLTRSLGVHKNYSLASAIVIALGVYLAYVGFFVF